MTQKFRYDAEDNVLMIWLAEGKTVDHAEQSGDSILHLSSKDEPVLLEIMNARAFILDLVSTAIPAGSGQQV
jgi:uncharacterized protein YuzE